MSGPDGRNRGRTIPMGSSQRGTRSGFAAPNAQPADPTDDSKTLRDIDVKRCTGCGARFGVDAAFCPFCGLTLASATWDPQTDALVGTIVDQRYEVAAPIGEGGMGTVYRVRHTTLDRDFAMKVLRHDLATDRDLAARFTQEARATAAIKHPAVVSITDFGVLEAGTPYFVMELLKGETVATRIRARGPMAPAEATVVGRKLADALDAAHAAGVVHRDLKPENVFLVGAAMGRAATSEIRIVDFGAAKVVGASKLTRPGVVFGTPYYMSPEQASGERVDGRADVYSLGVLLYEMLTGDVPFVADTYMGVLTKHMFQQPTRPSERVPAGVNLGPLEDIVLRMMAKDPNERYRSMREVENALLAVEAGVPPPAQSAARAPLVALAPAPRSTADLIEASVARTVESEDRRRRSLIMGGAAAVITIVVGMIVILLLLRPPAPNEGATNAVTATSSAALTPTPTPIPTPTPTPIPIPTPSFAPSTAPIATHVTPVKRPLPPSAPNPTVAPPATAARPPTRDDPPGFRDPWAK